MAGAKDASPAAVFALVVGVNQGADPGLTPLRYADDDAARYADLFAGLGARVEVLTRADDNTRRIHPQIAADAHEPRLDALRAAAARIGADVRAARAQGRPTVFYLLYAGHGNAHKGEGYVTLEDARLYGRDLITEIIDPIGANQTHVIVDACQSFFLARTRGPGGKRREVQGFSHAPALATRPDVGLLLSTSTARESHEWEVFQSGIFSHEVRSGLYGAADLDGDGQVSYREIGAFVERANAGIPNERFRPNVYARPPRAGDGLLDLRAALSRQIAVPGAERAHYALEDGNGVRIAEFHKGGRPLRLLKPDRAGPLYLQRLDVPAEYVIEAGPAQVDLALLDPHAARTATRGAAHHAFGLIFSLPFDSDAVDLFQVAGPEEPPAPTPLPRWRTVSGRVGWATAGGALAASLGLSLWANHVRGQASSDDSQLQILDRNHRIETLNRSSLVSLGVAGVTFAASAVLLKWFQEKSR